MYKVGIIGCGHASFNTQVDNEHQHWLTPAWPITHYCAFNNFSMTEVCAVSDINETLVKEISNKYQLKPYTNYMDMIDREDLDIISIATPVRTHYKILNDVLLSSKIKGVFCEKPIAANVREAREVESLCKKYKKPVLINLFRNYDLTHIRTRDILRNNAIGRIDTVIALWEEAGIQEVGTHPIGLIPFLIGSKPKRVFSKISERSSSTDDASGLIIIEYENGVESVIWVPKAGVHHMDEIKIIGEKGYVRLGKYVAEMCKWSCYGTRNVNLLPEITPLPARSFGLSPMQNGIASLINAIEKGEPLNAGVEEAVSVLEVVVAAFKSAETGKWIDIPLSDEYYDDSIF